MSIYEEVKSPEELARRFASYMRDPSTIRARVKEHFGRAPSVEECRRILDRVRNPTRGPRVKSYFYERFRCDHERTEENAILMENGEVFCRTCHLEKREKEQAKAAQKPTIPASVNPGPMVQPVFVMKEVARRFNVTVDELTGPRRERVYVNARSVVVKLLRERNLSFSRVGFYLKRDHASIKYLAKTYADRAKHNPDIPAVYHAVKVAA